MWESSPTTQKLHAFVWYIEESFSIIVIDNYIDSVCETVTHWKERCCSDHSSYSGLIYSTRADRESSLMIPCALVSQPAASDFHSFSLGQYSKVVRAAKHGNIHVASCENSAAVNRFISNRLT